MAQVFVHAQAATAGGGVTYLRNFLHMLRDNPQGHRWRVLVPAQWDEPNSATHPDVQLERAPADRNPLKRLWTDQINLRRRLRAEGVDLFLATGNFGLVRSPVPQVLLNRNALYFSHDHVRVLKRRKAWRELANTLLRRQMALASIRSSAINIVPTAALADDIRQFLPSVSPERFAVIPHGFDHSRFSKTSSNIVPACLENFPAKPGVRRVLMVSHYNYFRNFETLLRGFALLKNRMTQPVELLLTTKLGQGVKDHRYDTTKADQLLDQLEIRDQVVQLGTVPGEQLGDLYQQADAVVCASYAESFGHPMVEAMACGRPVVASDRGCHREVCGNAALHFSVFDPSMLADQLLTVLTNPNLARQMGERGRARALEFCWTKHFDQLTSALQTALEPTLTACV